MNIFTRLRGCLLVFFMNDYYYFGAPENTITDFIKSELWLYEGIDAGDEFPKYLTFRNINGDICVYYKPKKSWLAHKFQNVREFLGYDF